MSFWNKLRRRLEQGRDRLRSGAGKVLKGAGRSKGLRIGAFCILGALALAGAAAGAYLLWEQAPKLAEISPSPSLSPAPKNSSPTPRPLELGEAISTERRDGVYTFLLAGNDDGTGNTDTIMVGKLDTVRHSLDIVSIPRDTIINVEWDNRKLNGVYWGSINNGGNGIDALKEHVKKLTGFYPDCYAVVDLEAVIEVVDLMGGVWFDVPFQMDYDEGPVIHLQPGYQLLDGYQAMGLCRYRDGYVNGDLERISVQHQFLKAVADQCLSLGSIPQLGKICQALADSMDTDLSAANIAYLIRQAMKCPRDKINFYTAPNTPKEVRELSYTFLDLRDWIDLVNQTLNPYSSPVGEGDLDLVYLHNGSAACTTVLNGAYYYQLGSGGQGQNEPEPVAEPVQEEAPEAPEPIPIPAGPQITTAPMNGFEDDWLTFK